MNILSVEEITMSYGVKELFNSISFGISKGDKVGMVARNGSGKSTLFKIIAGKETPRSGNVIFRKGIQIGYLSQSEDFNNEHTVEEVIYNEDNIKAKALKSYKIALETGNDVAMNQSIEELNNLDAWDYETEVQKVLGALKVNDLKAPIKVLSGGQKKRLSLAMVLLKEPDFLLLDEPTNHLDLEMIEWLEAYLGRSKASLLMITHDRYFLENICDTMFELEDGELYKYAGNYSAFLEKKEERIETEKTGISKSKNLYKKELEWMRRMPKARGTKSKARISDFYEIKQKALKRIQDEQIELEIKMERLGNKIAEFHKVSKSYPNTVILKDFSYKFQRGEKIGIVGKNGTGKSSFLHLLTGKEAIDSGKISIGETVKIAHYKQEGIQLKEDKRIIEVIKDIAEFIPLNKGKKLSASQMLDRFLFPPKMQYQFVHTLSGGEKRRLYLLTIFMQNPNFLILDEPTNDLDIDTLNVLEDYLEQYTGCLLVVSHDRYFLDKITDHLLVFNGQGDIKDIIGSYTHYLELEKTKPTETTQENPTAKKETDKPTQEKIKWSFNQKREFGLLEIDIEKLEKEKKELEDKISQTDIDFNEIETISNKLSQIIKTLESKTDRWLELSELNSD